MLALHHFAVVTADLARSEAFYCGVLGLQPTARHLADDGSHRSTWLGLGHGAFLALERASAPGPTRVDEAPGHHCLVLGIPRASRNSWRRRLEDAGFPILRETQFTIYARDPDGCLVGLSHHPVPAQ